MKKILAVLAVLAITGCSGERENQVRVGSCDVVYTVIIEGHKYVIYDGFRQGGIVHAESCVCKKVATSPR